METRAIITSNSCFFAAQKSKFPEEWIAQGNEQFLIRVSEDQPRDQALFYQN